MRIWVVGVIINVGGSILVNAGTNLLKLSTRDSDASSGFWYTLGKIVFSVGSVINFVSFGLAAQSLLASLGGVQFIANCFFGGCILGETLTLRHVIASVILVVGVVIAVSFSNHQPTLFTLEDIMELYDARYATFCVWMLGLIAFCECVFHVYSRHERRVLAKTANIGKLYPFHSFVKPITYCLVSASLGTQSVLQSKCIAELVKLAIIEKDIFILLHVEVAMMSFVFLFFLSIWLHRLMHALSIFGDGLVIIPILQTCWTLSAVIQGGVFFREFDNASKSQIDLFTVGILLIMVGVYVLAGASPSALQQHPLSPKLAALERNTIEYTVVATDAISKCTMQASLDAHEGFETV
jgi:hypothetical protein